jgi:hypothetical protein
MKIKPRISNIILLILCILSFSSLIYILYQISNDIVTAININKSALDPSHYISGAGYLLIFIFHVYSIIFIYSHFHHFHEFKKTATIMLILGIISFFAIAVEKVMMDEIAREYRFGLEIKGELFGLYAAYLINLAYTILVFFLLLKTVGLRYVKDSEDKFVEEKIFTIAQILGIISSLLGMKFTFLLIKKQILSDRIWIYVPFLLLFLIPYIIAVLYWLSLKWKQKIADWYDEKQFQDILKASLTTLLLSVPLLAIFQFTNIPAPFYWFLFYIFSVLFLFSSATLFFFKIRDMA